MTHRPYIQQENWVNKTCSEKSVFLPHTNVKLIFKYSDFKTLQLKLTNLIIRLKHLEFTWSLHKMKYYLATLYLMLRNTLFKLGFCFIGHLAHDRCTKTPFEKKGLNSLTALCCNGEKYLHTMINIIILVM